MYIILDAKCKAANINLSLRRRSVTFRAPLNGASGVIDEQMRRVAIPDGEARR